MTPLRLNAKLGAGGQAEELRFGWQRQHQSLRDQDHRSFEGGGAQVLLRRSSKPVETARQALAGGWWFGAVWGKLSPF